MRIFNIFLAVVLMIGLMIQSYYVGISGEELDLPEFIRGGQIGRLAALLLGVGVLFNYQKPYTALYFYTAAAVISLLMALPTGFQDLFLWGGGMLLVAFLSYLSYREIEDRQTFKKWILGRSRTDDY